MLIFWGKKTFFPPLWCDLIQHHLQPSTVHLQFSVRRRKTHSQLHKIDSRQLIIKQCNFALNIKQCNYWTNWLKLKMAIYLNKVWKSVPQKLQTVQYLTKSDKQYSINLKWWPLCGFWHCSLEKHFCSIILPTLTSCIPDTFQCYHWGYGPLPEM